MSSRTCGASGMSAPQRNAPSSPSSCPRACAGGLPRTLSWRARPPQPPQARSPRREADRWPRAELRTRRQVMVCPG